MLFEKEKYKKLDEERSKKILPLINHATSEEEVFRLTRLLGIGGSDIAMIFNKSKWKTAFNLWQTKTMRDDFAFEETAFTHWGHMLEASIIEEYFNVAGHLFGNNYKRSETHTCEKLRCLVGNLDGVLYEDDKPVRIIEIKTAMTNAETGEYDELDRPILSWGNGNVYQTQDGVTIGVASEDHQVPMAYYLQVQAYMLCLGVEITDIAVLIGHHDFRVFTIHANKEVQDKILKGVDEFWCLNVLDDNAPALTALDLDDRTSIDDAVTATPDVESMCFSLSELRKEIKILDSNKTDLENKIKVAMGDNDKLLSTGGKLLATYKTTASRASFDKDRLMKEQPSIYQQYLTAGKATRRFTLKPIKAGK